jgi:hypothetical protein
MSEGSRYFDQKSGVHTTLQKICKRLNELDIPYAIAGGMALFKHGFRRFTEDVDILIARDDLKRVHRELNGLGYIPLFAGSKNLRDTESGVRIEFLISGAYPGDGKQKPVVFPNPGDVGEIQDEVCYLNLPTLVELKMASGMTGTDRIKDLADVQELIKLLSLPVDFDHQLDPYVRSQFRELWHATRDVVRRYTKFWQKDSLAIDVNDIDKLIAAYPDSDELVQMRDDGVKLELKVGTSGNVAYLVTTDPAIASKYDMHDESGFWDDNDDGTAESDPS